MGEGLYKIDERHIGGAIDFLGDRSDTALAHIEGVVKGHPQYEGDNRWLGIWGPTRLADGNETRAWVANAFAVVDDHLDPGNNELTSRFSAGGNPGWSSSSFALHAFTQGSFGGGMNFGNVAKAFDTTLYREQFYCYIRSRSSSRTAAIGLVGVTAPDDPAGPLVVRHYPSNSAIATNVICSGGAAFASVSVCDAFILPITPYIVLVFSTWRRDQTAIPKTHVFRRNEEDILEEDTSETATGAGNGTYSTVFHAETLPPLMPWGPPTEGGYQPSGEAVITGYKQSNANGSPSAFDRYFVQLVSWGPFDDDYGVTFSISQDCPGRGQPHVLSDGRILVTGAAPSGSPGPIFFAYYEFDQATLTLDPATVVYAGSAAPGPNYLNQFGGDFGASAYVDPDGCWGLGEDNQVLAHRANTAWLSGFGGPRPEAAIRMVRSGDNWGLPDNKHPSMRGGVRGPAHSHSNVFVVAHHNAGPDAAGNATGSGYIWLVRAEVPKVLYSGRGVVS